MIRWIYLNFKLLIFVLYIMIFSELEGSTFFSYSVIIWGGMDGTLKRGMVVLYLENALLLQFGLHNFILAILWTG